MSSRQSGDGGGFAPVAALSAVIASASKLARNEVALVRAEIGRAMNEAKSALVKLVIAAVLAMVGLNVLAGAIVAAIVQAGLSPAWSAVIVGVGFLLIGLGYAQSARSKLKMSNLAQGRSARSLAENGAVLSSAVKGDSDAQG